MAGPKYEDTIAIETGPAYDDTSPFEEESGSRIMGLLKDPMGTIDKLSDTLSDVPDRLAQLPGLLEERKANKSPIPEPIETRNWVENAALSGVATPARVASLPERGIRAAMPYAKTAAKYIRPLAHAAGAGAAFEKGRGLLKSFMD